MIFEFARDGIVHGVTNETYIYLIPKKVNSSKVKDFRPINLVTSCYKIISKNLSNRLKGVLEETIAETQGAFVEGKQILDVVLVANEIVEEYRRKGKEGFVFKINFEKAYDYVEWRFLDYTMEKKDLALPGGNGFDAVFLQFLSQFLLTGDPEVSLKAPEA